MIDAVMYGMIPSAKSAMRREPAAAERVQQVQDAAAAELALDLIDGLDVDARHRDVRAEAVEREQQRREGELLADLRDRKALRIVVAIGEGG